MATITTQPGTAQSPSRAEQARRRRQRRLRLAAFFTLLALVLGGGGTVVALTILHLQGQLGTARTQLHYTQGELKLAQGRAVCRVPQTSTEHNGVGEMVSPVWSHPSTGAINDVPVMTPTSYAFDMSPLAVQKVLSATFALRGPNGTCSTHTMAVRLGPDRFALGSGHSVRMMQVVATFPAGHPPVWVKVTFKTVPPDAPASNTVA